MGIVDRRKTEIQETKMMQRIREAVHAETFWIDGVSLEEIPPGREGSSPGMVLVHQDWNRLYFLKEREGWVESQYFDLAEKLIKERGIVRP